MSNYTLDAKRYTLTIGWLYPELMSTYGDRGNIIVLQKRCQWRGISAEMKKLDLGFRNSDLELCDILFMGGAQDKQQKIVSQDLREKANVLQSRIEGGIPGLYICGAYQFLGKYYKEADGAMIEGLGIFDLYTENPGENHPRLIGNIIAEVHSSLFTVHSKSTMNHEQTNQLTTLVGFENHGGRTYLGKGIKPLAKVISGFGNNGDQPRLDGGQAGDKTEGAVYKNSFGSYMHGPILPKNPHFADFLIKLALKKKYKREIELKELDDSLEWQAHRAVLKKLKVD